MADVTARFTAAIAERYRIERQLGAGGMAAVFLAHDLRHDRKVALKLLQPELAAVLGAERFLEEIRVTAKLQHPHILPLHDSGEADGFLYYVMPYMDGETLRERLTREHQLAIAGAVDIARTVAEALDYAHRHGVVHRDIKPENILLHDGQPLVADFGIALAVRAAGGTRLTATGISVGTPQYMSPEQAMGDRELDARSDVYSLGAVLYEMLAGSPPYAGATAQAIVAKVLTEKAPPITVFREAVPPPLAAVIHQALARLPADRFPSAAEFAVALASPSRVWDASTLTSAPSPRALDRRARLALPLAGLALALGGVALWGWFRPEPTTPVRRLRLAPPPQANLSRSLRPALSPDGSRLVYVGASEVLQGGPQLYLQSLDRLDATPLPGTEGGILPFFSPDGARVAFFDREARLKVVGLGGEPPLNLSADSVVPGGGCWGRDGYLYLSLGVRGGLVRMPATGGALEPVTMLDAEAGEVAHILPDALPDGNGILFTLARTAEVPPTRGDLESWDIAVADLATGRHVVLVGGIMARYAPPGHLLYVTADGTLLAAPFDARKLRISGPSVALAQGLAVRDWAAELAVSERGIIMFVAGITPAEPETPVWVDRDGAVTPLDPQWTGGFHGPVLSPDGRRVAVALGPAGDQQIWIKQLEGGPAMRLTFEGRENSRPGWSPDGRTVIYESNRGGNWDIYAKPADGSAPEARVLDGDRSLHGALWSRDGLWLVAREGGGPGSAGPDRLRRDIIAVRLGGDSVPRSILATPAEEWAPALSPDGRYLAYVSDEAGRPEVYVRPFPETGRARWQVSAGGGTEPLWANSGRELFYRSERNLMVASVVTRPGFAVAERRVLVPLDWTFQTRPGHRSYDVTPDDRRFLMIKRRAAEGLEIVLIENWMEDLEARAGR